MTQVGDSPRWDSGADDVLWGAICRETDVPR